MPIWNEAVDVLREAMFAYAQVSHGNLAAGIMAVTFLARLALFPLTLRLARAAAAHQEAMRRLQPELESIRQRFKADPGRVASETQRILTREGVSMVPGGFVGGLLQMPVLLALFTAVRRSATAGGRFLWISDISRPNAVLAVVVAALTAASMAAGPQVETPTQTRLMMLAIPMALTVVALWQMAAGVGLYWGVSSAVGVAQGLMLRRERKRGR